jgi:UDP-N-acetylmuramoyl-tripeptide--D-alanyl-D-alanine ligase
MMTLGQLAAAIPGSTLQGPAETAFALVSTDTRALPPECLFFALRGERYDAHDFAHLAAEAGAVAMVVERPLPLTLPQLVVTDSRRALGLGATAWRNRYVLPLIAVTGSNGKTTVTQMLASILAAASGDRGRLATRGNLNNEIGVPQTVFGLTTEHRYGVVELGMNHPGEIEYLARIAQPTVSLVNNAQREHQEFMGTVEATARENGAAISALPANGIAVFPADDDCAFIWRVLAGSRQVMDFTLCGAGAAAVTATYVSVSDGIELTITTPSGRIELRLALSGAHNAHNAVAAATSALAAGVAISDIKRGLEAFVPVAGRGVLLRSTAGGRVIDDSYNANPDSVIAAIDLLSGVGKPRVLILGDMGEVGKQGPDFHEEIGTYARLKGIDALLAIGELSRHAVEAFNQEGGAHYSEIDELIAAARPLASAEATVLVKGSRFMRMERVVKSLC